MAYVALSEIEPLVIVRRVGHATAPAVSSMLAWVDAQMIGARSPRALVYDAGTTTEGQPDAQARRVGGEWFRRRRKDFERDCLGLDFAFPSAVSRGALTAVFWIAQPSVPYAVHGSSRAAIAQALSRARASVDPDAVHAALLASPLHV